MKLVSQRRERVRELLQRGGTVDFFIIFFAHIVGAYVSDGEWTTGSGALRAVVTVASCVMGILYVRRRHNLGGRVELPTWIVAVAVLAASIAIGVAFDGDQASSLNLANWGAGLLVIGAVYRKASLLLGAGALLIPGLGDGIGLPLLAWAIPLAVYGLIVGYLGRDELLTSLPWRKS